MTMQRQTQSLHVLVSMKTRRIERQPVARQVLIMVALLLTSCCSFVPTGIRAPGGCLTRKLTGTRWHMSSTEVSGLRQSRLLLRNLPEHDSELMAGVDLTVMPGDRVALVGQNGAGKSTLLQCIAGYRKTDEGKLLIKSGVRLGFLEQKGVSGSTRTVYEEASSQMHDINSARQAMEKAEEEVMRSSQDSRAIERLLDAQAMFEAVGGLTQDKTVAQILSGLGFSKEDQDRPCSEFSGGWQMRIALGKLLLSGPDLLLLDEPTNHLDAAAKEWLANFLSMYTGTVVTVSHDEALLEGVKCSIVAEVANKKVEVFKGCGYSKFLGEREERLRAARAKYELEQKEMARLQRFVDRFGAQATKASAAQSRVKTLQKMEENSDGPPEERKTRAASIKLPAPPSCHKEQLILSKASFGYGEKPIVADVDLKLEKGQSLAVLGPNGAGKSTLLKALAGTIPLSQGDRKLGNGLKMGVFTQDLAQDLPQDAVALDLVLDRVREYDFTFSDEQARTVLGNLGLTGPKALRKIGVLSGGEKARVALAIFIMIPYNLLMLDEPSNHLDSQTLDALVAALKGWKGTVVVVSHNKEFVTRMCPTHTAIVKNGSLVYHDREPVDKDWIHDSDTEAKRGGAQGKQRGSSGAKVAVMEGPMTPAEKAEAKQAKAEADKERKKKFNAPGRIKKIESLLEGLDIKIVELTNKMYEGASDGELVKQLMKEKEATEEKVSKLYAEWEELELLLKDD